MGVRIFIFPMLGFDVSALVYELYEKRPKQNVENKKGKGANHAPQKPVIAKPEVQSQKGKAGDSPLKVQEDIQEKAEKKASAAS